MNNELMYANNVTITTTGAEVVLTFRWMLPELGENGKIVSEKVAHTQTITVSNILAKRMVEYMGSIVEKESANGTGQK